LTSGLTFEDFDCSGLGRFERLWTSVSFWRTMIEMLRTHWRNARSICKVCVCERERERERERDRVDGNAVFTLEKCYGVASVSRID